MSRVGRVVPRDCSCRIALPLKCDIRFCFRNCYFLTEKLDIYIYISREKGIYIHHIYMMNMMSGLQINPSVNPDDVPFGAHDTNCIHCSLDSGEIAASISIHAQKRRRVGIGWGEIGREIVADTALIVFVVLVTAVVAAPPNQWRDDGGER